MSDAMTDNRSQPSPRPELPEPAFAEFAQSLRNADSRLSLTLIATTCGAHAVTLGLLGHDDLANRLVAVDKSLRALLAKGQKPE